MIRFDLFGILDLICLVHFCTIKLQCNTSSRNKRQRMQWTPLCIACAGACLPLAFKLLEPLLHSWGWGRAKDSPWLGKAAKSLFGKWDILRFEFQPVESMQRFAKWQSFVRMEHFLPWSTGKNQRLLAVSAHSYQRESVIKIYKYIKPIYIMYDNIFNIYFCDVYLGNSGCGWYFWISIKLKFCKQQCAWQAESGPKCHHS